MDVCGPDFDLKRRLAEDASGAVLKASCDVLREGDQAVRRAMDQGLSPSAFQAAEAMREALALAEESLSEYWKMKHHTG